MSVEVGQEAPDFELNDTARNTVRLSDFRGRWNVVLVFYPLTFTDVCQGELCQLRDDLASFEAASAQVLAISCDNGPSQARWAAEQGFGFPLLSDFWPHGEVARAYGVFNDETGYANRATFVIDRGGKVVWTFASSRLGQPRAREQYRAALARLAA